MKRSFLIQRLNEPLGDHPCAAALVVSAFRGGGSGFSDEGMNLLRGLFSFDYMGAAEFEYGAVPKALDEITRNSNVYQHFDISVRTRAGNEHLVHVLARDEWQDEITDMLKAIAEDEWKSGYRFKESVRLTEAIDDPDRWDYRGWLELDNGYFFFVDEDMARKVAALFGIGWNKEKQQ